MLLHYEILEVQQLPSTPSCLSVSWSVGGPSLDYHNLLKMAESYYFHVPIGALVIALLCHLLTLNFSPSPETNTCYQFTWIGKSFIVAMIQGVWKILPEPLICIGFHSFLCSLIEMGGDFSFLRRYCTSVRTV